MRGIKKLLRVDAVMALQSHEGRAVLPPVVFLHALRLFDRDAEPLRDEGLHAAMNRLEHARRGIEDRIVHIDEPQPRARKASPHLSVVCCFRPRSRALFNWH